MENIKLNQEEAMELLENMDKPKQPSPAFIAAAKRYKESVESSDE